jgi:hypothetical protein
MFIILAAPCSYLGLTVPGCGRVGRLLLPPGPDCPGDRTLRAVWRRRPLDKVILRCLAATAVGLSSYRFGMVGILVGIRHTV